MNKRETHIVQGMTRDITNHRFSSSMVFDARNIRISARDGVPTLLSVTNEKGTSEFPVAGDTIQGTVIGTAVINNQLVLFCVNGTDNWIYLLTFNDEFTRANCTTLYEGNDLGMDYLHPLETMPIYENENIQKVYWVDGKNQPRMINIVDILNRGKQTTGDIFNFNREISPDYSLLVEKFNGGGHFPPGTIQYCFNYFNKFGQETNIVDVSPLYYLSPKENGLPADAVSNSSFKITLSDLDSNFDYVRVYSIIRTSENATPNVRILGDYRITTQSYLSDPVVAASIDHPVSMHRDNAYVADSQGNLLYKVIDNYPNGGDVPLGENEYIYDTNTKKFYANYNGNTKLGTAFCVANATGVNVYFFMPVVRREGQALPYSVKSRMLVSGDEVNTVVITDNGSLGSTLDATALLFIGGHEIIAGTFTKKDNTLFLGNIKNNVPTLQELKDSVKDIAVPCVFNYAGVEKTIATMRGSIADIQYVDEESFYSTKKDNNRSSYQLKTFKARENYRLGIIAQYKTGQWSEVLWVGDETETYAPGRMVLDTIRLVSGGSVSTQVQWEASYRNPGFKAVIPETIINSLIDKGFIRVAPVVVYPSFGDRLVPFQGILAGTVYGVADRADNSPFVQSDWRFRSGYNWEVIDGEIQSNPRGYQSLYPNTVDHTEFVSRFPNSYYRDPSILTFHSPDIESVDALYQSDFEGLGMRIVGLSNLGFASGDTITPTTVVDSYVELKTQGYNALNSIVLDFSSGGNVIEINPTNTSSRTGGRLHDQTAADEKELDNLVFAGFLDSALQEDSDGKITTVNTNIYKWITYLWHRSGSLNNQAALSSKALEAGSVRYGVLGKKIMSEIKYARTTFFQNPDNTNTVGPFDIDVDIKTPKLFNNESSGVAKIDAGDLSGLYYYGNIDKVLTPDFQDNSSTSIFGKDGNINGYNGTKGYPIEFAGRYNVDTEGKITNPRDYGNVSRTGHGNWISRNDIQESEKFIGKDPVSLKYSSTKHLVIGLSSDSKNKIVHLGKSPVGFSSPFWKSSTVSFVNPVEDALSELPFTNIFNNVFVAELYRTDIDMNSRFGGNSQEAIANNIWTRCGESVKLVSGEAATLYYREGDTYVGRYDCLKSYPATNEDTNQFVSIYSTEVESRVNLDFRYDNNRGQQSNLYVRPNNFNLFNHSGYEQTNQYFTFKGLDYDRYVKNAYPTTITWSLEKKLGEDIDTWTSITLTATADADGSLGEVTKLASLNDTIFSFQNRGFARILFNERVQIPTSDNTPIEITNGLKFGGLQYLSKHVGITNKWACCETINGLYFVDDESNALYKYANQLENLSTKFGFDTWFTNNNSYKIWNPVDYHNIRAFYDKVNSDIYFMTKDESLVFSEKLNTFTSFMDYASLSAMVGVNDKFFTFTENDNHIDTMWEMFGGNYNYLFGTYKPYWLTFVSNDDPTIDKVFNNLAWRSEVYDVNDEYKPFVTFDTLRVWHEHQDTGEVALQDIPAKSSVLKKKMNVFRTYVPRNKKRDWLHSNMDRIRNTWAKIQLKKTSENTDRQEFFDLDVNYFE